MALYGSTHAGNHVIRADESSDLRIVVPYAQVVEPCLSVIVISSVAEGVLCQDAIRVDAFDFGLADESAPQVVFVGTDELGVAVSVDGDDVSL